VCKNGEPRVVKIWPRNCRESQTEKGSNGRGGAPGRRGNGARPACGLQGKGNEEVGSDAVKCACTLGARTRAPCRGAAGLRPGSTRMACRPSPAAALRAQSTAMCGSGSVSRGGRGRRARTGPRRYRDRDRPSAPVFRDPRCAVKRRGCSRCVSLRPRESRTPCVAGRPCASRVIVLQRPLTFLFRCRLRHLQRTRPKADTMREKIDRVYERYYRGPLEHANCSRSAEWAASECGVEGAAGQQPAPTATSLSATSVTIGLTCQHAIIFQALDVLLR
jgi:hypothetical protein